MKGLRLFLILRNVIPSVMRGGTERFQELLDRAEEGGETEIKLEN